MSNYPHVFSPIRIGNMTLKNRIVSLPMMNCLGTADGEITPAMHAHMRARAKSGAGLVIMGETPVDRLYGTSHWGSPDLSSEKYVGGLEVMVEEIHRYGAKAGIEISHGGLLAPQERSPYGVSLAVSEPPACLPHPKGFPPKKCKIMDKELMELTKNSFVTACKNLAVAGFDMVLVHCGHGWLLSQFLSDISNSRTDEYGGSLENRMRYPLEVLKAIHEAVGDKMNVDIRVSVGGPLDPDRLDLETEEAIAFIRAAAPYINGANISVCNIFHHYTTEYMCQSYYLPHMVNTEHCARIKAAGVPVPVTATGSITTVAEAEEILASGKADLVGMGRATLADNGTVIKSKQGREDEIRPCMRCAYCTGRLRGNGGIRCAVNPFLGRELEFEHLSAAAKSKNVLIIGGGIAGMQAAQSCSWRGHKVTLLEKSDHLGGMGIVASALPDKYDMRKYVNWMIAQTEKCADVHLNTEATPELIREMNPDAVLVAIGAVLSTPPIEGIFNKNVVSAADVDMGYVTVGDRVVIAGAGLTGAECAIPLARAGKKVTLIDMLPEERFLADATEQVAMSLVRLYRELKIETIFEATIMEFSSKGVSYQNKNGEDCFIEADSIINALGTRVETDKVEKLLSVIPESYPIGDCDGGRKNFIHAVESANTFAVDL